MKNTDAYHHGHLRETLLSLGLEALETDGADGVSVRRLAERAGVSKTAPYRHFPTKELFLGALADEGFRLLHGELTEAVEIKPSGDAVSAMGRAYMRFAVGRPALYRLMNSPLLCRMPEELTHWAARSLDYLSEVIAAEAGGAQGGSDAAAAAWAYIHGLVMIRIDGLFPDRLPEPDWETLAGIYPRLSNFR
jgi:AcrR family transcriptional regulator